MWQIGGRIFGVGALLVILLHKPVYSQGSNLLQPTTYQINLNTPWSLLGTTLSSAHLELLTPRVAPSISQLDAAGSPESCLHGTKPAGTARAWGMNLTDTLLLRFFPSGKMQRPTWDASGDGNYSSDSGALWSYKKATFCCPGLTENQNVVQSAARASDTLMIQELWSSDHCLRLFYPCSSESTIVTQLLSIFTYFSFVLTHFSPLHGFYYPNACFETLNHILLDLDCSLLPITYFLSPFKYSRKGYVWVHWLLSSSEHLLWAKFSN